jgi:uncharacterized protein with FMN-binding domain
MKRIITSVLFVAVFTVYAVSQYRGTDITARAYTEAAAVVNAATTSIAQTKPTRKSPNTKTVVQPVSVPATKPKGRYVDGTYTGSVENAHYGNVQVRVTIAGGTITDVKFLEYPSDQSTSREINSQATQTLRAQAIATQSANVDGVSGATSTSEAFKRSLTAALVSAK